MMILACCQQTAHWGGPEISIPVPPATADKPVQLAGVHNVVTYAPNLIGGGVPEGQEGLHTLAAMGIRTIISVDGAPPDVAGAESLGMNYVHLPISYDTITPVRQTELARAIASVPGPVYVHCHHGKHRSAAALASAAVMAGKLVPQEAMERMKVSGTAKEYTGLWKVVQECKPMAPGDLKVDPATLPKISKVTGMVATMSEIDLVFDLVKQAQKAGWKPPEEHPDLVPAKETKRLRILFDGLELDPDSVKLPADYQTKLVKSIGDSQALDEAVNGGDRSKADLLVETLTRSCKECHKTYRDV